MVMKYWHRGHTKHRLMYHLVWTPKYRKRVLSGKIATTLTHVFYEACKVNNWWIEELKILPDHVRLLIPVHPSESVAQIVQRLKGGSSHLLWGESG